MKVYLFAAQSDFKRLHVSANEIIGILGKVAGSTDTESLVVALYLLQKSKWTGGTAYVRAWLDQNKFLPGRGKWADLGFMLMPEDLPCRFKLIRMALRANLSLYPLTEDDRYGWRHTYRRFQDHLAHLFAHELHHYRRHHLGLHPREGEHAANKWALQHIKSLGFFVNSSRLFRKRKRQKSTAKISFASVLNPMDFPGFIRHPFRRFDWHEVYKSIIYNTSHREKEQYIKESINHFEHLRSLPPGTRLKVDFDPTSRYSGAEVTLMRAMRRNSVRIMVKTDDGKLWRWPMTWLKLVD